MGLFDKAKLDRFRSAAIAVHQRPCVLLVDDEDANLRVMAASLGENYEILRASNGDEAWNILQQLGNGKTVACIISDQRMPGLSGVELCQRAFQEGVTAVRMIVTGYVDVDAIVDAINKAEIYKFIIKPFDTNDFRLTVQRAVESFQLRAELDTYVRELEQKVEQRTFELQAAVHALEEISLTDALTGIANRRRFDKTLEDEWKRADRVDGGLAALYIDIDLFKGLNDTLGHAEGDACLIEVAQILKEALPRSGDLLARYGGEEFAALMIGTTLEGALAIAERMRASVKQRMLPNPGGIDGIVTISVGVAQRHASGSVEELMNAADGALYRAKQAGRDRVAD